jgi:DNA-directed RNA polymerase subunit RPC12/RpoP
MKCPHCGEETYNNFEIKCPYCGKNMFKKDRKKINEEIKEDSNVKESESQIDNEETKAVDITNIIVLLIFLIFLTIGLYAVFTLIKEYPVIIVLIISIIMLALILWLSTKIKDIVVSVGRKVLDIGTSLNVVFSILIIIIGFIQCKDEYGNIAGFIWAYIGGAILFFLITLLADYTIYLLIDIRDSLKKIANKSD